MRGLFERKDITVNQQSLHEGSVVSALVAVCGTVVAAFVAVVQLGEDGSADIALIAIWFLGVFS